MCADKQRNKHTSFFRLAEVPWSAKFKSARTRPLLVSKKSFRFPTGKKNETQFGILPPRFRRKGVVLPGKRKSYKPCLAEFFFAIFDGDIGAGVSGVKPAKNCKATRELPALIGAAILLSTKYQEFVVQSSPLKINGTRRLCKF